MSKTPVAKQISWAAVIPQLVLITAVVVVAASLGEPGNEGIAMIFGGCLVVGYALFSRQLIARDHCRGIRLVKRKKFKDAILHFERSYEFFSHHTWLDKFRSIILLSASSICYREMALINIAFCHSQIGNGDQAKQYYQKALDIFPDSGLAQMGINMVSAFEKKEDSEQQNEPYKS